MNTQLDYFKAVTELHYMTIIENLADNLTPTTRSHVKRLMTEYAQLEPGIMNIILVYALRLKKGHIPGYNYLKKMVISWIENYKIDTAQKAFQFFINRMNYERTKNDHLKKKVIN